MHNAHVHADSLMPAVHPLSKNRNDAHLVHPFLAGLPLRLGPTALGMDRVEQVRGRSLNPHYSSKTA